jgi:hypothetical protein
VGRKEGDDMAMKKAAPGHKPGKKPAGKRGGKGGRGKGVG